MNTMLHSPLCSIPDFPPCNRFQIRLHLAFLCLYHRSKIFLIYFAHFVHNLNTCNCHLLRVCTIFNFFFYLKQWIQSYDFLMTKAHRVSSYGKWQVFKFRPEVCKVASAGNEFLTRPVCGIGVVKPPSSTDRHEHTLQKGKHQSLFVIVKILFYICGIKVRFLPILQFQLPSWKAPLDCFHTISWTKNSLLDYPFRVLSRWTTPHSYSDVPRRSTAFAFLKVAPLSRDRPS